MLPVPHWAGLAVSLCCVGCSLFLQFLYWRASPVGGGQARQQWAGWGSLPHTAPSLCPSATAPRLCTSSSSSNLALGHWRRVQGQLCCKKHFQEQQGKSSPSVMGGRYGMRGGFGAGSGDMENANGPKKVLIWCHLSRGFCSGPLLSCNTPDVLQRRRFWSIQHFLGNQSLWCLEKTVEPRLCCG